MAKRDDFSSPTKKILAEQAGQHCSNLGCGRSTSGPSDTYSGKSTLLGKASHITAAAKGGSRYEPSLSPEQRASADNGIWLCSECADRVDKRENEDKYPVELLKHWKMFHNSTTGTDFSSLQNRASYPVRRLTLTDLFGVLGEVIIDFGALTIFYGTSKLNKTVGELLCIFGDRNKFDQTRQPRSGFSPWKNGKIKLNLSDSREVIVCKLGNDVKMYIGDAHLPVFVPFLNVVTIGEDFFRIVVGAEFADDKSNTMERLSRFFGITVGDLKACIQGVPTDSSMFGYNYEITGDLELRVKVGNNNDFYSLAMLSTGEQNRFVLDMAIKIANHSSKVRPTILIINQIDIHVLDELGWAVFLEWVERAGPKFQIVVDRCNRPEDGQLYRAMCYEVLGTDMAVTAFKLQTWNAFKNERTA